MEIKHSGILLFYTAEPRTEASCLYTIIIGYIYIDNFAIFTSKNSKNFTIHRCMSSKGLCIRQMFDNK